MARGQEEQQLDAMSHALAGAIGGVTATILFYPIENLKTRIQVDKSVDVKSTISRINAILSEEGWTGFYKGLSSGMLGSITSYGVYFYWYSYLKQRAEGGGRRKRQISPAQNLLVALAAGTINAIVTNPIWVANTRMSIAKKQGGKSPGILKVLGQVYREEGLSGFMKGVGPAIVLVANPAIQFVSYEWMKNVMTKRVQAKGQHLTRFSFFWMGAASKALATLLTYPSQLAKSRMQAGGDNSKMNMLSIFLHIWKHEGFMGLFKGMGSKMTQTVLASAFMFVVYEELVHVIARSIRNMKSQRLIRARAGL